MDILEPPPFKEYRNKRFESFIKHGAIGLRWALYIYAYLFIKENLGCSVALLFMLIYFLVVNMSKQSIYFCDDKGLGPSWREVLMEDLAEAVRDTLVCAGGAWILRLIV